MPQSDFITLGSQASRVSTAVGAGLVKQFRVTQLVCGKLQFYNPLAAFQGNINFLAVYFSGVGSNNLILPIFHNIAFHDGVPSS